MCFHVLVAGDRHFSTLPSHSPKHGPLLVVCHEMGVVGSPRVVGYATVSTATPHLDQSVKMWMHVKSVMPG